MLKNSAKKAKNETNLKAIEFIRDTVGEKSTIQIETTNTNKDVTKEEITTLARNYIDFLNA